MDRLHDVVSEGKLEQVTNLTKEEVIGWLRDIAYTVEETINELENPTHSADQIDEWVMTEGEYDA